MKWNTRIHGMTLIETMVAVAIVATLSAIAIPAYGTYTTRSRVSECLVLAGPAKLAVSMRSTQFAFSPTRNCASITIAVDGVIVARTLHTGAAIDPVIQLTPTFGGSIRWHCGLVSGRYADVPMPCRNPATDAVGGPIAGNNAGDAAGGSAGSDGGSAGAGHPAGGGAGSAGDSDGGANGGSDTGSGSAGDHPSTGSGSGDHGGDTGAGGPSAGDGGDNGGGATGDGSSAGGGSSGGGQDGGSGGSAGGNSGGESGGNTGGTSGAGGDSGAGGSGGAQPTPSQKDICTADPSNSACANVPALCRYFGIFCPWR